MILHVTEAKYLGNYKIEITFNDCRKGVADMRDSLRGFVFAELKDEAFFAQFKVDKELDTITWSNGADFAPEFFYYQAFKDDLSLKDKFIEWGYINL
jgi:hypothetical protein